MSATLGGNVCVRDGFSLDYCFIECIQSLLPVCDVVQISDGGSTDGTYAYLLDWQWRDPKIKVRQYPWKNPHGDKTFWVDWLNENREHLETDYQIQLDADEVLHESGHDPIREFLKDPQGRACTVERLNFFQDAWHTIPNGYCLAKYVNRIAPVSYWMASDGYDPRGEELCKVAVPLSARIFHYNFLRKRAHYFKKQRLVEGYFLGEFRELLAELETQKCDWMRNPEIVKLMGGTMDPFEGTHPQVAHDWLRLRGWLPLYGGDHPGN